MAVTDLTDGLPWWARQGAGPSGGPGAAPQGSGGVGGQPPPGMNQQAWLQYLMQMFNPGSAQAAEVPPDTHGDGPPGPVSPVAGQPPINNFSNPPPANGPGPGNVGPVPLAANGPRPPMPGPMTGPAGPAGNLPQPPAAPPGSPGTMPARPAGVSASGVPLQPGSLAPGALAQFGRGAGGPIGSGGNAPWPSGGGSINPTAPPPAGQTAPGTGGAGGVGATSNPRFIGIDQPNATAQNSMRSGPQGTALNLAGMFGGGAPGPVAGPMAKGQGGAPKGDNWKIDPNSGDVVSNAPMPPTMPDDIRRQRAIQLAAARSGFA